MSMTDHFEKNQDAGFVRSFDPSAARRQFRVSVFLIIILALAAFVAGLTTHLAGPHKTSSATPNAITVIRFAGSLPTLR